MNIHTLASGATLITLSPGHSFQFSDGTSCPGQDKSVCDKFTLRREGRQVKVIHGHRVNETQFLFSFEQLEELAAIAKQADLVLVAFPVLTALREMGLRNDDRFRNVVAMNATPETQRSAPADKVVDVDNWSW